MVDKIIFFIFGTIVGSFLNVCIYRMPREMSIRMPNRSFCPACKKTIFWYDNIPILSYLLLGGRCRFCKAKISPRYAFVELITGLLFVAVVSKFGISTLSLIYLAFVAALVAASFIDIDFQIIPDEISLGGIVAGLLLSFIYPALQGSKIHLIALYRSFLGVLIGGGIIYITGWLGSLAFKKEAMGGGDVKLLAMMGAFLGWQAALIIFFSAPFLGTIISIGINIQKIVVAMINKNKDIFEKKGLAKLGVLTSMLFTGIIPYGPFLSVSAIFALFYKEDIIRIFLSLFTY